MKINEYIEITNEDNMKLMARYPDNYFDLAIVDPPYGLNIALNGQFKKYGGKSKWDIVPEKPFFKELIRASKNQIIWGWNYFSDLLPASKAFIYWNKLNHHDNRSDGELAYCSLPGLARHFEYMWDGNRYGFKGQKINGVGRPSIRIHPTQKPVALYEWLFKNYAKEGDKILDTHLGSGSIAIALHRMNQIEKMNLTLTACELDEQYYNDAVKRIKQQIAQQTIF